MPIFVIPLELVLESEVWTRISWELINIWALDDTSLTIDNDNKADRFMRVGKHLELDSLELLQPGGATKLKDKLERLKQPIRDLDFTPDVLPASLNYDSSTWWVHCRDDLDSLRGLKLSQWFRAEDLCKRFHFILTLYLTASGTWVLFLVYYYFCNDRFAEWLRSL